MEILLSGDLGTLSLSAKLRVAFLLGSPRVRVLSETGVGGVGEMAISAHCSAVILMAQIWPKLLLYTNRM